jgi:hypothetical protein
MARSMYVEVMMRVSFIPCHISEKLEDTHLARYFTTLFYCPCRPIIFVHRIFAPMCSKFLNVYILYITYKCFVSSKPTYLRNMPTMQLPPSSVLHLSLLFKCPHIAAHLQITNRFVYHSAPVLWNALPEELHLYNFGHLGNTCTSNFLLYPFEFHKKFKSYLFSLFYCMVCYLDSSVGFDTGIV